MRRLLILGTLLCACGGSSSPVSTRAKITGTVNGETLTISDAALVVGRRASPAFVALQLTNKADSCITSGYKDLEFMSVGVISTTTLDAGSFPIYDEESGSAPPAQSAHAELYYAKPDCSTFQPANSKGASGRVTFTRFDLGPDGGAAGSFDVLLQSGDRLKGTFDAPLCPEVADAGTPDAGCR